jgi:flavin reductase (DIM6/NTAB) family NADH-FMN oxidoreductase RutF
MLEEFSEISPLSIQKNFIDLIGNGWMLITSGTKDSFNTMTASWGAIGNLWNKPVAFCFIRPQRYTFNFMEKNVFFSLSFFKEKYRNALTVCGNVSGRNQDKVKKAGLTPLEEPSTKTIFFKEAFLVLICRKIYFQDIKKESILDFSILENYEANDFHRMYIGEIVSCLNKL